MQEIQETENELEELKHEYLRRHGWTYTSCTPGAFWLWRRDFADLDAERAEWDREHGAGEPGDPSASQPFGVITAPTNLAVSITARTLDREQEQETSDEY